MHIEYELLLIIPIITLFGYLFGKYTCGFQTSRQYGLWVTVTIFTLLNLFHSVIDGTLFVNDSLIGSVLMSGHELIRQPVLYTLFAGMIAPFTLPTWKKILFGFLSISGTWVLGLLIGKYLIPASLEHLDSIGLYAYAFFAGDIIHHVVDYFYHKH